MYGPQQEPLREDMPLADYGIKPAVSAAITRQWQTAHRAGRVKVAALRAPDFYGPEVSLSHIGDVGFGALAKALERWAFNWFGTFRGPARLRVKGRRCRSRSNNGPAEWIQTPHRTTKEREGLGAEQTPITTDCGAGR